MAQLYVFQSNTVNPMYIQQLKKVLLPPVQNIVGLCKQITILIFYEVISRLVTLRKLNLWRYRILIFMFLLFQANFVFQIFPFLKMQIVITPRIWSVNHSSTFAHTEHCFHSHTCTNNDSSPVGKHYISPVQFSTTVHAAVKGHIRNHA
jgi:hypothetical protein